MLETPWKWRTREQPFNRQYNFQNDHWPSTKYIDFRPSVPCCKRYTFNEYLMMAYACWFAFFFNFFFFLSVCLVRPRFDTFRNVIFCFFCFYLSVEWMKQKNHTDVFRILNGCCEAVCWIFIKWKSLEEQEYYNNNNKKRRKTTRTAEPTARKVGQAAFYDNLVHTLHAHVFNRMRVYLCVCVYGMGQISSALIYHAL